MRMRSERCVVDEPDTATWILTPHSSDKFLSCNEQGLSAYKNSWHMLALLAMLADIDFAYA
jgi:hypothetical protein